MEKRVRLCYPDTQVGDITDRARDIMKRTGNDTIFVLHVVTNDIEQKVFIESISKKYKKGIPQGSSLGPILWNLYIDGMLKLKSTNNTNIQAFADDTMRAKTSYQFTSLSEDILNKVNNWIVDNKLEQLKYLGIIVDVKLNWLSHLSFVKSEIVNVIQNLKRNSRATWVLKPKILKDIYILSIEKMIT
ncbi:uncharacterized protein LOC143236908 [Tachypleus tridentatus]|uniref:uncharacterized protein LOC143236908 n=1 Tax=Tachypleus tridentatus TaxID=6853 RepID=UPI003FD19FD6